MENKNNFLNSLAKDCTAQFETEDIKTNRTYAALAYFSWLCLIPIFAAPNSKFAKFHANQGLNLAILETASWIIFGILGIMPVIGIVFRLLNGLISLVCVCIQLIGMYHAISDKAMEYLLIGSIKLLK